MRWTATLPDPSGFNRWFAWYPIAVDYPDGKREWVWLECVNIRWTTREGGAWTLEGRR